MENCTYQVRHGMLCFLMEIYTCRYALSLTCNVESLRRSFSGLALIDTFIKLQHNLVRML